MEAETTVKKDIDLLQSIQNGFTKKLMGNVFSGQQYYSRRSPANSDFGPFSLAEA